MPINFKRRNKTDASTVLLGAAENSDVKRLLTTTNQTAARAVCEHSVLCWEFRSEYVQLRPPGKRSRAGTRAPLRRPSRRRCRMYCTSPLRRQHTACSYQHLANRETARCSLSSWNFLRAQNIYLEVTLLICTLSYAFNIILGTNNTHHIMQSTGHKWCNDETTTI